jgi:hypothetical protein
MKKITFFAIITLIISFLGSCKKDPLDAIEDDEARMYGKIVERGTKKPVKGARVYLRNCKCVLFSGCGCTTIDSVTTDASGSYDFTYKFQGFQGDNFDLFVRVPERYRQEKSALALAPTTHANVNHDIEVTPRAWVKVHVKNINPFDEYDKVWISGGWSGGSHDNIYYGEKVGLYFRKEVIGNDSCTVSWDVTKNKIDYFTKISKYCVAHDTTYFDVLY